MMGYSVSHDPFSFALLCFNDANHRSEPRFILPAIYGAHMKSLALSEDLKER